MLTLLALDALLACAPPPECPAVLWYVGDDADTVLVDGDWSPAPLPMLPVEPSAWRLSLALSPGDHVYSLIVDGLQQIDLLQPLLTHDPLTGAERSLLRVGDCTQPVIEIDRAEASASGEMTLDARFLPGTGGRRLDAPSIQAHLDSGEPLRLVATPSTGDLRLSADGLAPGKHRIELSAEDRDGRAAPTVRASFWVEDATWSWADALIYQVVIDRFARGDGHGGATPVAPEGYAPDEIGLRMGGDLAGVTARINAGWFDALGVGALWLSPVVRNAEGAWPGLDGHEYEAYHGYWPVSSDEIEPALGTDADLTALVDAAHARGMRVLLDVVPNHVHIDHPYWAAHADDGWFHQDPDCVCGNYDCPWSGAIETCWFTDYLPDLDWDNSDVADAITAETLAWASRFDLDGFRVDAVPMLGRPAVRELTAAVRDQLEAGGSDFYLLGETYTGVDGFDEIRSNLGPWGLDGQFEFPIMWALRDFVAWGGADAATLEAVIGDSEAAWEGSGAIMAPFVGNHDVSRFLSEAAGDRTDDPWGSPPPQPADPTAYDKLVLAQAIALTLPGAPVIYQGDELGLAGATDPDSRRPLPDEDALDANQRWTLEQTRRLGRTRRCLPALRRGQRVSVIAEGTVYAHLRTAGDGAPALLVVNASDDPRQTSFTLPGDVDLNGQRFVDVLGGDDDAVTLSDGATVSLPLDPWAARLFVPADSSCADPT